MGRHSTGSITVQQATALRMKDLRAQVLKRGRIVSAVASFPNAGSIGIKADWTNEAQPFLQLQYEAQDGTKYEYRIEIAVQRSNLGTGDVLYFLCPESGRRCRTLYMAYNYLRFKARQAYRIRLYYSGQLTGGRSRFNDLFWKAEQDLQDLQNRRQYLTYKGRQTRLAKRIEALQEKQEQLDLLRWTEGLPAVLYRQMF